MPPRSISALVVAIAMTFAPFTTPPVMAHGEPPQLTFPQDVSQTVFHDDWRDRRSGGRRHQGNDLMAPKMTEVYAAAAGVVAKVDTSRRSGRYLIIEHVDGWETYYIHLNNDTVGSDDGEAPWSLTLGPGVYEGAVVEAGQLIGWVGDSGNAEGGGSHTHFELLHNGASVNPHSYLLDAWEREVERRERLGLLGPPPVIHGFYRV